MFAIGVASILSMLADPSLAQTPSVGTNDYCPADGLTDYEWIEAIHFGSQVRASGNNGGYYQDNQSAISLAPGPVSVRLAPGFLDFPYEEHWQMWIDFDHDGAFEASELVLARKSRQALTTKIHIPESAKSGKTGVRVAMRFSDGEPAGACESDLWGEVGRLYRRY